MSIGRIGNYEILERIGEGGMGVVFKARDLRLLRTVALKILTERSQLDREHRERLLHEARALAAASNSHIAACHECSEGRLEPPDLLAPGVAGPHPETVDFIVMEFVAGRDLRAILADGPMPVREVLRLATQIASGIAAAHEAGVIHRDLTPSNIRCSPAGEIKILDFGLARSGGRPETRSTDSGSGVHGIAGTVGYMAPEQAAGGHVDERTDLFSLGVILYQMITGHLPFEGSTIIEVLNSIANSEPHPLARYSAHVPPELQRIVGKLLEKDPGRRYHSARELHTDLERVRESLPQSGPRRHAAHAGTWRPLVPAARGWWFAGIGAVGAVLALGILPVLAPNPGVAQRVAFMEFRNRTGDPDLDYVCSGLSTDLAEALVQGTHLTVTRSEARTPAGRPLADARAVAQELGVDRVISGELDHALSGALLELRVFEGRRGRELARREFELSFPLTWHDRQSIAEEVVHALGGSVAFASDPERDASSSTAAYEAYLHGLDQLGDPDDPSARDRALEWFDRALKADSKFALAWAGRARALWWIHERSADPAVLERASEAATIAVERGPHLVQTHLARARIDRETGRLASAADELRHVLAVNPNLDEVHLELGSLQQRAGKLDDAEKSFRRAVALRPQGWRDWNRLGGFLMMARSDYAGARLAYEKVAQLSPASNRGFEGVGNSYVAEGRYAEAIQAYGRMPRPVSSATTASNIANAYFFSHQLEPALRHYLQAVSLEPERADLRQNLGDCYQRMRRTTEARLQYLEAVKRQRLELLADAASPMLRTQMAVYLAKAGECDSSAAWLASLDSALPEGDAELLHELAKAHALCGRPSEAIVALRKMLRLGAGPGMLRDEDEFVPLRSNAEFEQLLAGR
jgi:tetratricopeptide (TPR) repeat protein/TolB-like protein